MNRTEPRIVVVGSSNTDMILRVRRLPRPGETVLGGALALAAGGKGANQAVAAARAGGAVVFIARLGRDVFGDRALAGFRAAGLDIRHVRRDPALPSGAALICVDDRGENQIAVASGANAALSPADVRRAAGAFRGARALVMPLETPLAAVEAAAGIAAARGVPIVLNPAPARPLPDRLLRRVTVLTPNASEAEILTGVRVAGTASAKRAAEILLRRGVRAVVLTLGRDGAYIASDGLRRHVPGFRVRAVDTTAAGDIFNGALAVALAEGKPLEEAVPFANRAAAISVTRLGAQASVPTRAEVDAFRG